jgi:NADPH:quinone reductase-like Zn-dependent oxidoreductase
MMADQALSGLELRSLITGNGELKLSFERVVVAEPATGEIVVQIEATPLNPSDIGLIFGAADISTLTSIGSGENAVVTARVPPDRLDSMAARFGQSLTTGNEGAGTVVKAGSSEVAQRLLGKRVAMIGGSMHAQFRVLDVEGCEVLPDHISAIEGASWFVNPLTALGMVETMRRDGHTSLVHTAAASNLGKMLIRLCEKDGIPLVNVVRRSGQVVELQQLGAKYVLDSSATSFPVDLRSALAETQATIAFDAIGGGALAGVLLESMEDVRPKPAAYSRYGSSVFKQIYAYGNLDSRPIVIPRTFGLDWGVCGWLLFPFLRKIGPEATARLRRRAINELNSTFVSNYSNEISLLEMLNPANIEEFYRRATGSKFIVRP